MNDDELKDKSIGYRPDINYEDEYGSVYEGITSKTATKPSTIEDDDLIDNSTMENIQLNIDEIVAYINGLPVNLQTAINQVFKPIFKEWYEDLKDRDFPTRIPDPTKPIIVPKDPQTSTIEPIPGGGGSGGGSSTGGGGGSGGNSGKDPTTNIIPSGPGGGDNIIGTLPPLEDKPEVPEPSIYTPEPYEPIIPEYVPNEPVYPPYDELESLFEPSSPWNITYEKIDPIEQANMEYAKNLAELYLYFTDQLKNTLGRYYMSMLSVLMAAKTPNQLAFVNNEISLSDVGVNEQLKHLMDSSLRSEVMTANKLSFCENMFLLENTLYHLKAFKTAHGLRLRYLKEEKSDSNVDGGSMSNNILNSMSQLYDKKYDVAYINLYKYLNSFNKVLSDMFNSHMVGLRSKETLIKKGGIK